MQEVVVEESPENAPLRTTCCSEPLIAATNECDTAINHLEVIFMRNFGHLSFPASFMQSGLFSTPVCNFFSFFISLTIWATSRARSCGVLWSPVCWKRSAKAETLPESQFRPQASAITTQDAALGPTDQTEIQTTMLEKILNSMESTCTIESYVYEAFISKRDSTEATSMVSRTRRCQQLCKESGAAIASHTYMAVWPNLECV